MKIHFHYDIILKYNIITLSDVDHRNFNLIGGHITSTGVIFRQSCSDAITTASIAALLTSYSAAQHVT